MTIIFFVLLCIALLLLIYLWRSDQPISFSKKEGKTQTDAPKKEQQKIMEVFDYYGTKILQENGAYTVNDKGRIVVFPNWELLPNQYKKMVHELDSRSLDKKNGDDYFMEILNGYYYVSMPGGKKKRYKTYQDIPAQIRKKLGKL